MTALLAALRDGRFLTRERLAAYPLLLLGGYALGVALLLITAHGLNDFSGRPLGTDFSSFYTAGKLVLAGHNPFEQSALYRAEQAIFGTETPFYSFSYPPIFLLLITPFAYLPYAAGLTLWLALTFAFYLFAMTMLYRAYRASSSDDNRLFLLASVAFPALFINLMHGQNGFLSAALMTLGLAFLDKRPVLAGLCFGCLAFKPQLGVMLPFALAAGGRWKSFAGAVITVLVLGLASLLVFGWESWRDFFVAMQFSRRAILENDAVGYDKMVSLFAAIRLWHGPLFLSYGLQALASLAAAILTVTTWRGTADLRIKGAILCLATLLATPFALDYDLILLAPALALLVLERYSRRFYPFELSLISFVWLLPAVERELATIGHIILAPFAILALMATISRPAKA